MESARHTWNLETTCGQRLHLKDLDTAATLCRIDYLERALARDWSLSESETRLYPKFRSLSMFLIIHPIEIAIIIGAYWEDLPTW